MVAAESLLSPGALRRWSQGEHLSCRERILLALRWFDWASASELYDALDVVDQRERNLFSSALSWMLKRGQVERVGGRYRIGKVRV